MNITPWFCFGEKPARKGVYQRAYGDHNIYYAYWDGKQWFCAAWSPMAARREKMLAPPVERFWRGLANPPKETKQKGEK